MMVSNTIGSTTTLLVQQRSEMIYYGPQSMKDVALCVWLRPQELQDLLLLQALLLFLEGLLRLVQLLLVGVAQFRGHADRKPARAG